jgi:hypothetical protein
MQSYSGLGLKGLEKNHTQYSRAPVICTGFPLGLVGTDQATNDSRIDGCMASRYFVCTHFPNAFRTCLHRPLTKADFWDITDFSTTHLIFRTNSLLEETAYRSSAIFNRAARSDLANEPPHRRIRRLLHFTTLINARQSLALPYILKACSTVTVICSAAYIPKNVKHEESVWCVHELKANSASDARRGDGVFRFQRLHDPSVPYFTKISQLFLSYWGAV